MLFRASERVQPLGVQQAHRRQTRRKDLVQPDLMLGGRDIRRPAIAQHLEGFVDSMVTPLPEPCDLDLLRPTGLYILEVKHDPSERAGAGRSRLQRSVDASR